MAKCYFKISSKNLSYLSQQLMIEVVREAQILRAV